MEAREPLVLLGEDGKKKYLNLYEKEDLIKKYFILQKVLGKVR